MIPATAIAPESAAAARATARYLAALQRQGVDPAPLHSAIATICAATDWEHPRSALDFNNLAVLELYAAEAADSSAGRAEAVERATDLLVRGSQQESASLCAVHIAWLQILVGEPTDGFGLLDSLLAQTLALYARDGEQQQAGLLYLPQLTWHQWPQSVEHATLLGYLFSDEGQPRQQLVYLSELLSLAPPYMFNAGAQRFISLASGIRPQSAFHALRLGLNLLRYKQQEGLYYLHRAVSLDPTYAAAHHALYLAYKSTGQERAAAQVVRRGRIYVCPDQVAWRWLDLSPDAPWTYAPFGNEGTIAIEASLSNGVTCSMVSEPRWREPEFTWWCDQLQPGMTVVDVGANVGYYTLASAQKVGAGGRVIAVEPTAECLSCLHETLRLNALSQVTIVPTALSHHQGVLAFHSNGSSELNHVATTTAGTPQQAIIPCTTLDDLCEKMGLTQIDLLKIDVEGHELAVLQGAERMLSSAPPVILYENIGGPTGPNHDVAALLWERHYRLFAYHPFLRNLRELHSTADLQSLNVIAIPEVRVAQYLG